MLSIGLVMIKILLIRVRAIRGLDDAQVNSA